MYKRVRIFERSPDKTFLQLPGGSMVPKGEQ